MAKVRVYELAKDCGMDSKDVLAKLQEMGEFVRSASSTVEPPVVRKFLEKFPPVAKPAGEEKPAKKAPAKKAATKKSAAKTEEVSEALVIPPTIPPVVPPVVPPTPPQTPSAPAAGPRPSAPRPPAARGGNNPFGTSGGPRPPRQPARPGNNRFGSSGGPRPPRPATPGGLRPPMSGP